MSGYTERQAREELRRPLRFGDDAQIRAIRFLDAVEDAYGAIREGPECTECNGSGQIYEYDADCDCGGEGCDDCEELADCLECDGLGYFVSDWPYCKDEVMQAAVYRIKTEKRRR